MFFAGIAGTLWHLSRLSSNLVELTALEGTSAHADSLEEVRTFYTSDVVERLRGAGVVVTHDYTAHAGAIPLPVTFSMELGRRIGERASGMRVRLYSDYPFPWRKGGGPEGCLRGGGAPEADGTPRAAVLPVRGRRWAPVSALRDRGSDASRLRVLSQRPPR